ncbi:GPI inositol-deacylase-like [Physella acuta]|uniref:GPI inositol-deacylase-like n=1 Tax=Physella acuta TaxID=109671 RepID=UPI0027DC0548|nr:GPI inositol-deacylase-like [Physella acuta]
MAASIPMSISILVLSIAAYGFYDVLTNFETNGCEMTYMYEYPKYQEIKLDGSVKEFPTYRLFIYGEGHYANTIRNLNLKGIPVLFIPGNAGSHKQVRSLGSVALRMSEKTNVHFNYFVVDFDEELSALYGGVLRKQTEFVHLCLKKILSLYNTNQHKPDSVVLVGHSMGGLIARALFTLPEFDPQLVNTIVTQATPHQKPVASLDPQLQQFYKEVNQHWRQHSSSLQHVTVVSTGGGYRDIQVRYDLTRLDGIVSPNRSLSVLTNAVPKAWVSTDHLCAVWCRQVVLLTKRAMFDLVDKRTLQISHDADLRMKVFKHHFLDNNGLTDYLTPNDNIILDPKVKWEVKDERLWKYSASRMTTTTYFAIPFVLEEGKDSILVMSNLTSSHWVCYCNIPQGQEKCTSCTNLSTATRFLPPNYANSKYVRVMHKDIESTNSSYILILANAGEKMVNILVDQYDSNERHLVYQMPNTYDTIISYPISATDGAALLRMNNASTFYSLHLAGLSLPTNAYKVYVTPHKCRKHSAEPYEGSVLRLNIPWSHEEVYSFASYGKEASLSIRVQTARPAGYDWRLDSSEPHLEMFLHPYCHYKLRLVISTPEVLGQAVRFYAVLLPAYFVAVLFMSFKGVLITQGKGQVINIKTTSPSDWLFIYSRPYYIVPTVIVIRYLLSVGIIKKLVGKLLAVEDDSVSLSQDGVYFSLLPALLYVTAYLASYIQTALVYQLLRVLGYLARCCAIVPGFVSRQASYLQLLVSVAAILSTFWCGTLGLFIFSALLTLRVLQLLYTVASKMDTQDTHQKLLMFFHLMLLVNLQTLLNLGSFIVWLKRCISSQLIPPQLSPDPSQLPALVVCVCLTVILLSSNFSLTGSQNIMIGWLYFVLATVTLLYGMESLYRLPTFLAASVFLVTLGNLSSIFSSPHRNKGE